jgi:hypothetical protein
MIPTARTFHIGGTLTLDGGTLSWEEGSGITIRLLAWNMEFRSGCSCY